jgi:hypothetical protein
MMMKKNLQTIGKDKKKNILVIGLNFCKAHVWQSMHQL